MGVWVEVVKGPRRGKVVGGLCRVEVGCQSGLVFEEKAFVHFL